MRYCDMPKVVDYLPNLEKLLPCGTVLELQGVKLRVVDVQPDEVVLTFADQNDYQMVLSNGDVIRQDEWFEKYMKNLDLTDEEAMPYETPGEIQIDPIQDDERDTSTPKLFVNGDAGKREDDSRRVLDAVFD